MAQTPGSLLNSYLSPGSGKACSQTQADGGVRVESPGCAAEPGLGPLHDPRARAQHPPVQASSQPACLNHHRIRVLKQI